MPFSLEAVSRWPQETAVLGGCPGWSALPTPSSARARHEAVQVVLGLERLALEIPLPLGSPAE